MIRVGLFIASILSVILLGVIYAVCFDNKLYTDERNPPILLLEPGKDGKISYTYEFELYNYGFREIVLSDVFASCGCSHAEYSPVIRPFSSGFLRIKAVYRPDTFGAREIAIAVLNSSANQKIIFKSRSAPASFYAFSPGRLDFGDLAPDDVKKMSFELLLSVSDGIDVSLLPASIPEGVKLLPLTSQFSEEILDFGNGRRNRLFRFIYGVEMKGSVPGRILNADMGFRLNAKSPQMLSIPVAGKTVEPAYFENEVYRFSGGRNDCVVLLKLAHAADISGPTLSGDGFRIKSVRRMEKMLEYVVSYEGPPASDIRGELSVMADGKIVRCALEHDAQL